MINLEEKFHEKLNSLFGNKYFSEITILNRGFAYNRNILPNSILFIGLNPSFTEKAIKGSHFYELATDGNYKYFKRFEEITKVTGILWQHLDLLAIRETDQKKVTELLKNKIGLDFVTANLNLTKEILELSSPKTIVVENTLSRKFLGKDKKEDSNIWLGYDFEFDEKIGTDRIKSKNSNLYDIPVFFTSMLTGQRAMDNGSFERLKWHIRKVTEQK